MSDVRARYEAYRQRGLKLDMTRGKPAPAQLELARGMLENVTSDDFAAPDGTDTLNYGGLEGLPEARALMGAIMSAPAGDVLIGGNSSLQLMFDTMVRCQLFAPPGGEVAWGRLPKVRFLCPVPGYDRHFAITEHLGYELVSVPMTGHGPDMDIVERLVAEDASIKGMWLVPKYGNPTGESVDAETAQRLAAMKTAAPDFRIFWDDAYAVHHLGDDVDVVPSILELCKAAGHPDRPFLFASTSKITHAGAGISAFAASPANIAWTKKTLTKQTIGPDKVNQLRHIRFLRDGDGVAAHMKRHAEILRPKFEIVLEVLDAELAGTGLATWTRPKGGYFISLDTRPGFAQRVVRLADEAGVKLTAAGATHPYGRDPEDRNIRLAPSYPGLGDLRLATEVVATCVKLAWLEQQ
jgi:DNA-binding transcriptional MocR family regulator